MNDFQTDVLERSLQKPVLVDFWAEWCAPCRQLGPILEKIAEEHKDQLELVKIDTEKFPEIAGHFGIRSIPNVKLFMNGQVHDEFSGALPEEAIMQWLEKSIPELAPEENPVDQARMLLASNKNAEAILTLTRILKEDSENQEAKVLLAQIEIYSDDPVEQQHALELVKEIRADSDFFQQADSVRLFGKLFQAEYQDKLMENEVRPVFLKGIQELQHRNFAEALEKFIEVIRLNRAYDDDASRKICIAIFKYLTESHEITRQYRPLFSRTLNA
ncbi:MAG: thioredoxin [SAR324 cluster bacterium]|nr:thioredoxin [SAR324 cluster bacterium]